MKKQLTTQEPVPVAYQVRMSDGRWGTIFHHPDKPLGEHRSLYANPLQPSASVVEALKELLQAVCGETGFAARVRQDSGRAYPWPALDAAEAKAQAALHALKDGAL